jgi:glycosyltransferase involved in cell wall biosynthesis
MKQELMSDFGAAESKISVIPFGINNTVPNTTLTTAEARRVLDIDSSDRTLLFFGQIAPYKGLESLIAAFTEISKKDGNYRLIIAGKPQEGQSYWSQVERSIAQSRLRTRIIERIEYIPDDETELYFKAADVVVLPYARIFQSGVLFLAYAFGLPVIAADVGSLRDEVIEGETGFVFSSGDALDLARKIDIYFKSELFHDLENRRAQIKQYANKRYSWDKVATIIKSVYSQLLNI